MPITDRGTSYWYKVLNNGAHGGPAADDTMRGGPVTTVDVLGRLETRRHCTAGSRVEYYLQVYLTINSGPPRLVSAPEELTLRVPRQ